MASEEDHSGSEQILITDSGGRESEGSLAGYLMDEMLSLSMTDSPSFRQTIQKMLVWGSWTLKGANRGQEFEEKVIIIDILSWECFKKVRTNSGLKVRLNFYR